MRDSIVIITAWALQARVVAHVHGSNFGNFYEHASPAVRRFVRSVMERLTRVILLAERFRNQFAGLVPDGHVHVLYNAVDTRLFGDLAHERPKHDAALAVLFVGHLSQAKGFVDLLRAAPAVLENLPTARFVFAGEWFDREGNILYDEGGRRLYSDPQAEQCLWNDLQTRYGERVAYLGVVTGARKTEVFKAADVFVLPSYSEGFPMSVLEAMAAGLPLVVTPVGALPEVLQDGVNAEFVLPGDIEALAEAIADMGRHPERRAQMGLANRKLVETSFTPRLMSMRLADVFRSALE